MKKESSFKKYAKVKLYDKTLWAKYLAGLGVLSSFVTFLSFFVTSDDLGICPVILIVLFLMLIASIFLFMWLRANNLQNVELIINDTRVTIGQGDIWELIRKNPKERIGEISVIAVNDYFDNIVDNRIVSEKSLHGQYMKKLFADGKLLDFERVVASDEILNKNGNRVEVPTRKSGRTVRYSIGSVVEFESYVLAAFSKFDNNKACLSAEEYIGFWMRFWENIDEIYAGRTINIPLIGAGITRFRNGKPNKQELLEIILWTLKISGFHNTYADRKINIVIYPPDTAEIDLYHIQHNRNFR